MTLVLRGEPRGGKEWMRAGMGGKRCEALGLGRGRGCWEGSGRRALLSG